MGEQEETKSLVSRLRRCSEINYPDRIWTEAFEASVLSGWQWKLPKLREQVLEVEARTPGIGLPKCRFDNACFPNVALLTEIGIERLYRLSKGIDISHIDKKLIAYLGKWVQSLSEESLIQMSLRFAWEPRKKNNRL